MHNVYPLAREKLATPYDMLSDHCKKNCRQKKTKKCDVTKLISNSDDKTSYVLYSKNLQFHLSLGVKLIKIHRVLKFKQSDWMKKYIDFNTEKRANHANIFKLTINSVYGKQWETYEKVSMSD